MNTCSTSIQTYMWSTVVDISYVCLACTHEQSYRQSVQVLPHVSRDAPLCVEDDCMQTETHQTLHLVQAYRQAYTEVYTEERDRCPTSGREKGLLRTV